MTLETERLNLRPLTMEDAAAVHAYGSVPENVWYMIWGPNSYEDTLAFLRDALQKAEEKPRMQYDFGVVLKSTGRLVGSCGIYKRSETEAMLGWILHRDFWKQGYGTELAAALLKFGFEQLRLHRIYATCNADNYGSYRVMERNGMRREGHFRKCRHERVGDHMEWTDELLYAMLVEEWFGEVRKSAE